MRGLLSAIALATLFGRALAAEPLAISGPGLPLLARYAPERRGRPDLHGVTRKVVLTARNAHCVTHRTPTMALPACGANLETPLNRSEYGVGLFTPLVADRVTIRIGVEAILGAEGIEGQFQALPKPPGPAASNR